MRKYLIEEQFRCSDIGSEFWICDLYFFSDFMKALSNQQSLKEVDEGVSCKDETLSDLEYLVETLIILNLKSISDDLSNQAE